MDPTSCTDPFERYLALGNEAADQIAKGAALSQLGGPTPADLQAWERQAAFLYRYLRYVPIALALWPQVSPTSCRKSLPRRDGADASRRGRGASFRSDVLAVLRRARSGGEDPPGVRADDSTASGGLEIQAQGAFSALSAGPAEAALAQEASPPEVIYERHNWRWRYGRWICGNCLARSSAPVPPRSKFPGRASNLESLLRRPRGHQLQVAPFTDGKGLVVICSKCGHYATSNRPCQLHKKECPGVFGSEGAKHSYERVCRGQHPMYSKGAARVLEPCMSPAMLEALART